MKKHGTAEDEFMHESLQKDAVQHDLPTEEIIQALAYDNEHLQADNERLRRAMNEAITYCETLNKIKPNYGSAFKLRILLELGDREKVKLALEENLKSNYKISLFDLLETEDYSLIYQMLHHQFWQEIHFNLYIDWL